MASRSWWVVFSMSYSQHLTNTHIMANYDQFSIYNNDKNVEIKQYFIHNLLHFCFDQ